MTTAEYKKQWREDNKEKLRDYFRAYRLRNKQRCTEISKRCYDKNRSKRSASRALPARKRYTKGYNAQYLRVHGEQLNARKRLDRIADPERFRSMEKRYRDLNREQKRERDRIWRANNSEKYMRSIEASKQKKPDLYKDQAIASAGRRRARKKLAPSERFTIASIAERDGDRCHLCGETIQRRSERSIDHLIPIVRSGPHLRWNVMLAHMSCNKKRATKQILREETEVAAREYIAACKLFAEAEENA
jgi:5-methylcytosine-specific restriction endonuclease McrA